MRESRDFSLQMLGLRLPEALPFCSYRARSKRTIIRALRSFLSEFGFGLHLYKYNHR